MIIHQRSIPLTCLTASIAKPIKYDKEHDLIGCKKSRCLSPDLRRIFGHGGRGHLLYGRTCNPGQRRSQAQISSMKPLLRHGQLTAQQNIKGRMPCIYFGLNLFCSQVAMRPPCVAIIERAKCLNNQTQAYQKQSSNPPIEDMQTSLAQNHHQLFPYF